ncbi:MAG TPA: S9 family peptidase, partial [Propionibacteriaceae bacterium]|nr:S9 family peptidase [Propionibacteriaceae bacterium]
LGENDEEAEQDAGLFPQSTQLTEGDADHTQPVFSADGRSVVVVASRHESADTDLVSDLYRFSLDGGAPVRLTNLGDGPRLGVDGPAISEDGELLFFVGADLGETGRDFVGRNPGLFVMPASGGEPTRLTDADSVAITSRPVMDGLDGVLVIDEVRGHSRVLRVLADGTSEVVLEGTLVAAAVEPVAGSDEVVVTYSDPRTSGDVGLVDSDGTLKPLTDFSASLREHTSLREPIELDATAPDGYPVHGWVVVPEGEGPHPVLLTIHGGPFAAYHGAWFDEFQVYAHAGYAVVACNPRGSFGYGQDHGRVIKEDMGNLDMVDILAFLDHAVATVPGLDGERVGIQGGSYGGYMTAWIIGHDHRWKGAIVERGYLDPASFIGASDIGWFFSSEYTGEGLEAANRQSPMMFTGEVTTPTLVLHSEQDLRCPLSQALRYYTEIKLNGVDAELLVFPGENHELSRSGTPHHRRQRFEKILDWWERKLPVKT